MQKCAFSVTFSPLPALVGESVYFDKAPVPLPYAEHFSALHYHDRYEIGICESGEGLFLLDGEVFYVSEGDTVFIPPEHRHYSRSLYRDCPCLCRFAYIERDAVGDLLEQLCKDKKRLERIELYTKHFLSPIVSPTKAPMEAALLRDIVCAYTEEHPDRTPAALLRLALFLLEMQDTIKSTLAADATEYKTDATVSTVAEYIATHYNADDTVADLAAMCNLSASQLRRRFLRAYSVPPIAYRNRHRTKIASALLSQTEMSVCEVASRVGYSDVSDFYRAFRSAYGLSPSAYRARWRT